MRFNLEGLDVFFPYDYLYQEQYDYMLCLKRAIDDKGHVLLEMPTGTGKTVCLISLITSYQQQFPKTGKLIYCTRTVAEMTKCMEEIKRVINYRTSVLGPEGGKVLAVCLSSRRNMCIHPGVMEHNSRESVDNMCRSKTAEWVRERAQSGQASTSQLCEFYEGFSSTGQESDIPRGVYSLEDLKALGNAKGYCPYFLTRYYVSHATIVVFNYQYMLDPKVSSLISKDLQGESIVVFDEAHNIDNVCIEALSVTLNKKLLDSSSRGVNKLQTEVASMKASDSSRLKEEYEELVRGLQATLGNNNNSNTNRNNSQDGNDEDNNAGEVNTTHDSINNNNNNNNNSSSSSNALARVTAAERALRGGRSSSGGRGGRGGGRKSIINNLNQHTFAAPILTDDILAEAVPGNIRKAEHFVAFLKKIVVYLKTLLNNQEVENKTPLAFLHDFFIMTGIERKPLRFTAGRLNSLLHTLQVTNIQEFEGLTQIANFVTIISTYLEGFAVITDPKGTITTGVFEPLIQLTCMNASIAIKPVLEKYQSVVITSGTLSPIYLYPRLLALDSYNAVTKSIRPVVRQCLPMSTFRPCLLPLIVTRGSDQISVSTRFEVREDIAVIRNYGQLLIDVAAATPDGICCFFTSYTYMEYILTQWDRMKIISQVMKHKLIFIETKDIVSTTIALDNYKRACDSGRGAVFLSIARGKVAEGVDFDRHYGRCVILFGIPYQYTLSYTLRARLNFMRDAYDIKDNDFLTFDALRQASQCIGRVIRSKTDYGVVILADARYNRQDKRSKFPPWVTQFIRESSLNLSTDVAVDQIKTFLRQMGQPIDKDDLHSILLNDAQVNALGPSNRNSYAVAANGVTSNDGNVNLTELNVKQNTMMEIAGTSDESEEPDLSAAEMSALYAIEDNEGSGSEKVQSDVVNDTNNSSYELLRLAAEIKAKGALIAQNAKQRRKQDITNAKYGNPVPLTVSGSLKRKSTEDLNSLGGNGEVNRYHELYLFEDILDS